jgi:hypothetical protein
MSTLTPEAQLEGFLDKYTPAIAAQGRALRRKLRARFPGAHQLVYDNYNALVIGFGPTERPSEAVLSVALFPDHVTLCFLRGVDLPDPDRLLRGGGNQVRHIRLAEPEDLDQPAVAALLTQAAKRSPIPFKDSPPGPLVIRSISAKQRPRRPAPAKAAPAKRRAPSKKT